MYGFIQTRGWFAALRYLKKTKTIVKLRRCRPTIVKVLKWIVSMTEVAQKFPRKTNENNVI